jgi:atrial natriuretic peptide receptor A
MNKQGESVHVAFAILILIAIPVELTLVSNYYTCPGIPQNEVGTKEQIKIGVVLEKPINCSPIDLAEMRINTTSQEGEFILQYSDYGMIAFKEIEHINKLKMHHHHHICLHYTFIDRNFKNIAYGANYIYLSNSVQQVVNGIKDNYQNKIHNDLMMRYTPVVSITHYQCIDICPSSPSPLAKIFLGAKYETPSCIGLKDANLKIVTTASSLFRAANEFLKVMGWRKFGIVTTCAHLLEYWPGNERVHLSLYLKNKKLIQTFDQAFQRYELNVYVFIGSIKTFYELLLDFDSYGFNRNYRYIIITIIILNYYYFNYVEGIMCG